MQTPKDDRRPSGRLSQGTFLLSSKKLSVLSAHSAETHSQRQSENLTFRNIPTAQLSPLPAPTPKSSCITGPVPSCMCSVNAGRRGNAPTYHTGAHARKLPGEFLHSEASLNQCGITAAFFPEERTSGEGEWNATSDSQLSIFSHPGVQPKLKQISNNMANNRPVSVVDPKIISFEHHSCCQGCNETFLLSNSDRRADRQQHNVI